MIRKIEQSDYKIVCDIVNDNWRCVYRGYVDPLLLTESGCDERERQLIDDFKSGRLSEYVFEENGQVLGMISFGKTGERDCPNSFEIWRLYIHREFQDRGIGRCLLEFAEEHAHSLGYSDIVIWAFKQNVNAAVFYKKHGYHPDIEAFLGAPYNADGMR
ncbi:MAG: GNAT family N-acetyltransferase, partial [Oscillospiraceae bacterium]|nr:GNAT family N-acetyltransferase [Oscillospiraceae bacterium]